MLTAAATLVKTEWIDLPDDPDRIVAEFRERFCDTERFFDPFAKGKFATYLFNAHAASGLGSPHAARQRVEEAQLFIEAAYAAYERDARRNAG
jgi:sulfite reductase (ferredoxin)